MNILFCVNAVTSYPLQILCAFEIVEDLPFFQNPQDSKLKKNLKLYTERILTILLVTGAAIIIPKFTDFLNISGAVGAAALGFVLPALYHMKTELSPTRWQTAINIFMIAFGIGGGIYSVYYSVKSLIE